MIWDQQVKWAIRRRILEGSSQDTPVSGGPVWRCREWMKPCVIRLSTRVSSLPNHPSFKDLYLLPAHLSLWEAENRLVTSLLFSLRKMSHAIDSEMPFIVRIPLFNVHWGKKDACQLNYDTPSVIRNILISQVQIKSMKSNPKKSSRKCPHPPMNCALLWARMFSFPALHNGRTRSSSYLRQVIPVIPKTRFPLACSTLTLK